ncbi:MAG: DNA double-strand break repair nuclease NurA [Thermoflexales bacterium]
MPLDVSAIRAQISLYAEAYKEARRHREEHLGRLCAPLRADFAQVDMLLETCRQARQRRWAGALFDADEPINQQFPFGQELERYALIATDGSQILPDRHKPFVFAYVQAGCAGLVYGELDHPLNEKLRHFKLSRLIEESELFDESTGELKPPTEVVNQRDLLEIELMAQACRMAREADLQPVLVADGSLVPFALLTSRNLAHDAEPLLKPFKAALSVMHECGAWVCGYIDRPNSNSIARACALAGLSPNEVNEQTLSQRGTAGIFDRHLLEQELAPARRTALFDPGWEVNASRYLGEHAMRACYVNFGEPGRPVIARIEAPQWCAGAAEIGALCAVLWRHSRLGNGYPLILKAAHDEAVVSKQDQRELEQAIEQAMLASGILARASFKQEAKERA